MKFSVILNYKNYVQTIQAATAALDAGIDYVVVVDNDSRNSSVGELKKAFGYEKRVKVLSAPENKGYASGNNFGILWIEQTYGISADNDIFILNPDVIVNRSLISEVDSVLQKAQSVGIVSGLVNEQDSGAWKHLTPLRAFVFNFWLVRWILFKFGIEESIKYKVSTEKYMEVEVVLGAFFGIRQDVFKEIGYFDSNTFLYYEEEILYAKLSEVNKRNVIINTVSYSHIGGGAKTTGKLRFKMNNDESRLYYLRQYRQASKTYERISRFVNAVDDYLLKMIGR
ncbi:glycosyltransferase [Weissella cibaria]|uniref:glycosyltransferase n=1 Tax=Weissella cibaria TaxID=137591 RepID=UPI00118F3E7E|nr:glycosyltransferase [Weissella cibaria]TVV38969.1 glycosyltransferase [Weissella cibaria]